MAIENVLTIDPGFHTGYAYWDGGAIPQTGCVNVSTAKRIKDDEDKFADMWEKFENLIQNFEPKTCIIESVETWGGSLKSKMASDKGDLFKLSYLVGGYCRICMMNKVEFILVSAREWKGQLPNTALIKRIKNYNGIEYKIDHIACAVGIGMASMGIL